MSAFEHRGTETDANRDDVHFWSGIAGTLRLGGPFLVSAVSFFAMGSVVPRRYFYFVHFEREMALTVTWYLTTCVAVGIIAWRWPIRSGPAVAGASVVAALVVVSPITARAIQYGRSTEVFFDALIASPLAHAADYGILALGALLAAWVARRPRPDGASDGADGPGLDAGPGGEHLAAHRPGGKRWSQSKGSP